MLNMDVCSNSFFKEVLKNWKNILVCYILADINASEVIQISDSLHDTIKIFRIPFVKLQFRRSFVTRLVTELATKIQNEKEK